jgi:hypothetical protein
MHWACQLHGWTNIEQIQRLHTLMSSVDPAVRSKAGQLC